MSKKNRNKHKQVHNFAAKKAIGTTLETGQPSYTNPSNDTSGDDVSNDPRFKVTSHKPYMPEIVTRSTVWDYYRTTIALPMTSPILKKLGQNIEIFDDLLVDPRVKACLNNRRAGTLSLKWQLDQNDCPVRMYNTIQKMFDTFPITEMMSQMLMATFYGFHVSEVNWEYNGGLMIPTNVVGKAARWFMYDDLNRLRYKTKSNQVQGEPLPPRKFIVTRYHPSYDDPYAGFESLASAVYWPVKFRRLVIEYSMNFAEKYGTPWLDVVQDSGLQKERLDEILDILDKGYQDNMIVHTDSTKIQALQIGDSKSMDTYTQLLDVFNREIDMAILGNNLSTEVKGGSYAAAKSHMDVRQDIIDEDKRMIETSMNQLIEWIVWYNYNSVDAMPKFVLYADEEPTKERVDIDIGLAKMGVKFKSAYFEKMYKLTENDFELGEPVPTLTTGIGGEVATPVLESDTQKVSSKDANDIKDVGIEIKDQASNEPTSDSVLRAQKKGYSFNKGR